MVELLHALDHRVFQLSNQHYLDLLLFLCDHLLLNKILRGPLVMLAVRFLLDVLLQLLIFIIQCILSALPPQIHHFDCNEGSYVERGLVTGSLEHYYEFFFSLGTEPERNVLNQVLVNWILYVPALHLLFRIRN